MVWWVRRAACHLCVYCADGGVAAGCLALLEAVVSYSLLPRAALRAFVAALCRTVNMDHYCQTSWKVCAHCLTHDASQAQLLTVLSYTIECSSL